MILYNIFYYFVLFLRIVSSGGDDDRRGIIPDTACLQLYSINAPQNEKKIRTKNVVIFFLCPPPPSQPSFVTRRNILL